MKTPQDHPEYAYLNLLQEISEDGIKKVDRGTDVVLYSLFGRQNRYDLSKGFPLLTTKKVYWKGVLHELYWFMSGQTNIKYLVDNNVHIWDDYPYKYYTRAVKQSKVPELTKEQFIEKIATDNAFAKEWGELPKIYGEMWRHWPTSKKGKTIDQLKWVMQEMKDDPDAKNLIVNSWNPQYLYTIILFPTIQTLKEALPKQTVREIFLLENLRFLPGEQKNDAHLAQSLASLADIYVNDAFSVSHREAASIVTLPHLLPSFGGFLLKQEIHALAPLLEHPQSPYVVVLGGAKISTKQRKKQES
jgi:thymidylate synthase